jgi:Putative Actinobacterial Holin-X, holin superfamily III
MPTHAERGTNGGLGGAAKIVAEHASTLARLELELAQLELKRKVAKLGIGTGLVAGAALFGLLGLGFVFLTLAAVLDTFLATWLALLIITVALVTLAGGLALLGLRLIKRGSPPVPEQAIHEAKLTTEALKS